MNNGEWAELKYFLPNAKSTFYMTRGKKRGFPRKAMGIFLGGIVFFVYLCTQKQIEHKGTKTQSLNISDSASLRLAKTKRRG